jgi:hypothetical protein
VPAGLVVGHRLCGPHLAVVGRPGDVVPVAAFGAGDILGVHGKVAGHRHTLGPGLEALGRRVGLVGLTPPEHGGWPLVGRAGHRAAVTRLVAGDVRAVLQARTRDLLALPGLRHGHLAGGHRVETRSVEVGGRRGTATDGATLGGVEVLVLVAGDGPAGAGLVPGDPAAAADGRAGDAQPVVGDL